MPHCFFKPFCQAVCAFHQSLGPPISERFHNSGKGSSRGFCDIFGHAFSVRALAPSSSGSRIGFWRELARRLGENPMPAPSGSALRQRPLLRLGDSGIALQSGAERSAPGIPRKPTRHLHHKPNQRPWDWPRGLISQAPNRINSAKAPAIAASQVPMAHSAAVPAQVIDENASAKVAAREDICRRRK